MTPNTPEHGPLPVPPVVPQAKLRPALHALLQPAHDREVALGELDAPLALAAEAARLTSVWCLTSAQSALLRHLSMFINPHITPTPNPPLGTPPS